MKIWEKFKKQPSDTDGQQPQPESALLRTYLTSLLCMVLCVIMFLGTTYAWFSSEVDNNNNEIYIGILDVELEKLLEDGTWTSLSAKQNEASITNLFDRNIRWEPGYTSLETVKVINEGDLAITYTLSFTDGRFTDKASQPVLEELWKDIAKHFDIWVYDHRANAGEAPEAASYAQITAADSGWEFAGSLADALDGKPVLKGSITDVREDPTEATQSTQTTTPDPKLEGQYTIALHMREDADTSVMGHKITLNVKLVAYQHGFENDDFGSDYDSGAEGTVPVYTESQLRSALEAGKTPYIAGHIALSEPIEITKDIRIVGGDSLLSRAEGFTGTLFLVKQDVTLTLEHVIVDGGGIWSREATVAEDEEAGITATGSLVATEGNGSVILEQGTVLRNNDGASAVSLATRGGGSLTVNGASILHNRAAGGGAIWGGGDITINEGSRINDNHATEIGGAIRMVNGYNNITFTMNGGEMNGNTSAGTGGAIWGGNNATYILNGGEMANNSAVAGGAVWTGNSESWTIAGDFKLYGNSAKELGGAIRFCDHASLTMTGGKVYGNTCTDSPATAAFFLNNNSATFTGGVISDSFNYNGGLGFTLGNAVFENSCVVTFTLGTNHKTAYLAEEFGNLYFTVLPSENVTLNAFNFKPAEGYTYTDGDEAKLVCLNSGYTTAWDAASGTFVLRAN